MWRLVCWERLKWCRNDSHVFLCLFNLQILQKRRELPILDGCHLSSFQVWTLRIANDSNFSNLARMTANLDDTFLTPRWDGASTIAVYSIINRLGRDSSVCGCDIWPMLGIFWKRREIWSTFYSGGANNGKRHRDKAACYIRPGKPIINLFGPSFSYEWMIRKTWDFWILDIGLISVRGRNITTSGDACRFQL